jgi:predicted TIM-barrel fold metal-dependent hydrolase
MPTIDSDAHVIENEITWQYLQDSERGYTPMITRRVAGNELRNVEGKLQEEFWVINARVHNKDRNVGSNTTEESREMRSIDARIRHMDELEIDVQILYPTLLLRPIADNPPLEFALCRSYNRWLADIWKKGGGRLRWVAAPPLLSMDKVRDEMQFAKDNGACGIFMRPLEVERPLSDPYFYPLYEIAGELDLAISVHLGNGSFDVHDFYTKDTPFTKFKLPTIGSFHSLVYNGTPAKFPKVRWGIIEASANWIPFIVADLRQRALKRGKRLPDNVLAANNIWVSCEVTDDLPAILPHSGEGQLVIGTDYGHTDNSSQIEALRMLRQVGGVSSQAIDKILWDNARALYGLN